MNNKPDLPVKQFYELTKSFGYLELEITTSATEDIYIDGWVGSSIRNNLLTAADDIHVIGAVPLRKIIDILTIKQPHPLYSEMEGGFPKGFGIVLRSHHANTFSCRIKKEETFHFSILLYGHFPEYYTHFVNAIKKMCERGIGNPLVPLQTPDITIHSFVSLSDFIQRKSKTDERNITIRYTVPTNLFTGKYSKLTSDKYIDRQHEFPGFSQLVRSAVNRITRLCALYQLPDDIDFYKEATAITDPFTQYAVTVVLTSAQLKRTELQSTAKKGTTDRIQFAGYTGDLSFEGNFNYYLPLLLFMQDIGVGSNTTYGLGRYRIVEPFNNKEL